MGGASENCLELWFIGLVVGRNYAWCLFIVVICMVFGRAKRQVDALRSSFVVAMQSQEGGREKGEEQVLWGREVLTV